MQQEPEAGFSGLSALWWGEDPVGVPCAPVTCPSTHCKQARSKSCTEAVFGPIDGMAGVACPGVAGKGRQSSMLRTFHRYVMQPLPVLARATQAWPWPRSADVQGSVLKCSHVMPKHTGRDKA